MTKKEIALMTLVRLWRSGATSARLVVVRNERGEAGDGQQYVEVCRTQADMFDKHAREVERILTGNGPDVLKLITRLADLLEERAYECDTGGAREVTSCTCCGATNGDNTCAPHKPDCEIHLALQAVRALLEYNETEGEPDGQT
jgi:hypothetical protein